MPQLRQDVQDWGHTRKRLGTTAISYSTKSNQQLDFQFEANPLTTGIGEVVGFFWTINVPPGLQGLKAKIYPFHKMD